MKDWKQDAIRGYQLQGAEWLCELPAGARGRLLADGLGTGKSRTALAAQRILFEEGCMENPCGLVFTTATSAYDWAREAEKFWPELKVHLIGSESAYQRKGETDADFEFRRNGHWQELLRGTQGPALIVSSYEGAQHIDDFITRESILLDNITIDECFVDGTQVWTEFGLRNIEDVSPGERVWAFNGQKLVLARVAETRTRSAPDLFEVTLPTHKVKVTGNHPFLTMKGWKNAKDLEEGDAVVQVVSEDAGEGPQQTVLLDVLLRAVAVQPAGVEAGVHGGARGADFGSPERLAEGDREEALGSEVNAHEGVEPDGLACSAAKNAAHPEGNRSPPESEGREREASAEGARTAGEGAGLAGGGLGAHAGEGRPAVGAEAGHRKQRHEGRGGSGWSLASVSEATGAGPEEGRLPAGFGLARVQGVEQLGAGGPSVHRRVHNLEVSGAHTYVVGPGLVVHNCHNLKKAATSRATLLRSMVARSRHTTLLTGTPISNRPHELHNLLDLCARNAFGSFWRFSEKFFTINMGEKGRPGTVGDVLDHDMLQEAISPYVMGRTATEVMGQMPARQRVLKLIDAPGAERISPAKLHLFKESTGIESACRNAVQYKMEAAVQLISDIDAPVVAYTYRREDAATLSKKLTRAKIPNLLATGDTTSQARDRIIERWKNGESVVLVCTLDAVKESATLTRAAAMVFVDLSWLPGTMMQCEGRIDPARQPEKERRPVTYYYLVTKDGPDEVVAESLVHKIEQMSGIGVKNGLADSFGDFLSPLDKRVKTAEVPPAAMLEDLTARLVARANRLADLGML